MVCWACGLDVERLSELEAENAALRRKLEAFTLGSFTSSKALVKQASGLKNHADTTCSEDDSSSTESVTPDLPAIDPARPPMHHAIRGFTAAGLADAAAVEEVSRSELEVKVVDTPRSCSEVAGACTVVHVRAFDKKGLLAAVLAVLAGMDLQVARAMFHTSEQALAVQEFWVQQQSADGLCPVLEGVQRRAIEQRVRQWSAGRCYTERPMQRSCSLVGDEVRCANSKP